MKPEIKQRIEQIKSGQIPGGYKKMKIGIVPSEWEETKFKKMFSRLNRKNSENNDNVLTISAQYGLISQSEFFNKSIASEDKSNYFLLRKGEYAYNKSYSNGYPFGALKRLDKYEKGIVSPLYICFSATADNKCPEYYSHYFECGLMNREIKAFAQEGARNHGLLNISVDDFFNSYLIKPSTPEQEKMAKILSAQDKVIELKEKLLEEKKKQKKYLMQQLLTGKKRSSGFSGEWKKHKLKEFIIEHAEKTTVANQYPVLTSARSRLMYQTEYYTGKQVTTEDNVGYNVIPYGYITFRSRSDDGRFKFNKNTIIEKGMISYFYPVFTFNSQVNADFMIELLNFSIYKKMFRYVEGTAQQVLSLKKLGNLKYNIPDINEQRSISSILLCSNKEISLLENDLEQAKQKKKSLMQLLLTGIVRVDK